MEKFEFRNKVIEILIESGGKIRASDLENRTMKELGIVHSTFYKKIRKLIDKDLIRKDRPTWKNAIYRLNYEALTEDMKERMMLDKFKFEIEPHILNELWEIAKEVKNEEAVIKAQTSWLGALCLWAMLKGIETGKPFIEIAVFYTKQFLGKQQPYRRVILSATPLLSIEEIIHMSSKDMSLGDKEVYQSAIKRWKQALLRVFPDQIKAFEDMYAKVKAQSKPNNVS